MNWFDFPQYSDEWWEIRRGVPTAGRFHKIITPKKAELSKSADDLICELIGETLSRGPIEPDRPINRAMEHGIQCEGEARSWYAFANDVVLKEVGFVKSADGRFGVSPDAVILGADSCPTCGGSGGTEATSGPDAEPASTCPHCFGFGRPPLGGLELKCPEVKTHVKYLIDGALPDEYKAQCHGQLIVTGLPYVDFVSYASDAAKLDPLVVRVVPDSYTDLLRAALDQFHKRYTELLERFTRKAA